MLTIGIDPGWSTFGIAASEDRKLINSTVWIPKNSKNRNEFIERVITWVFDLDDNSTGMTVYIERFVAYSGVQTSASEDILMLIGALEYAFKSLEYQAFNGTKMCSPTVNVNLVRALDWKVKVCRHLNKTKGFSNPYTSFDKKYSLLAAEILSGEKFKSDHEADAVCLSFLTEDILHGDKRK